MTCPDCSTKITAKHFDTEFDWYECPKCEGCFTPEELEENRASRTRGAGSSSVDNRVRSDLVAATQKVVAKGKKRRTEIQEDDEAIAKFDAEVLKPRKKAEAEHHKHRDELTTSEVVNIWADEIQAVYEEMGGQLDQENARDKALVLWRAVQSETGISARERDVPHVHCAEHK